MKIDEIENLWLRSLDGTLTADEQRQLNAALNAHPELATDIAQYTKIRERLRRSDDATFGPYFAQKVIEKLQTAKVGIDRQIMIFFKKYQLAALGLIMFLLTLNLLSADKMDVASVLGIEEAATPESTPAEEEDLLSFDLYENFK